MVFTIHLRLTAANSIATAGNIFEHIHWGIPWAQQNHIRKSSFLIHHTHLLSPYLSHGSYSSTSWTGKCQVILSGQRKVDFGIGWQRLILSGLIVYLLLLQDGLNALPLVGTENDAGVLRTQDLFHLLLLIVFFQPLWWYCPNVAVDQVAIILSSCSSHYQRELGAVHDIFLFFLGFLIFVS